MRRTCIRRLTLSFLLLAATLASAGVARATMPQFASCLSAHGVATTPTDGGRFLDLPAKLPSVSALDVAASACRRHVRWPPGFVHVGQAFHRLQARAQRFRACMRAAGKDPGQPHLAFAATGIALHFLGDAKGPPPSCAAILPSYR